MNAPVNKDSNKKELGTLRGSPEKRLSQINEFCKTHRPSGKVIGILESPNRDKDQLCTLIEIESKP